MPDTLAYLYVAGYVSVADAQLDYQAVKALHHAGVIGSYDAAIISKDQDGRVHVSKHEKPTQHGAWTGLAVGAVVGVLFPPALIVDASIGAGAGALIGHFARGLSRGDLKDLAEALDISTAALIVVAWSPLRDVLEPAVTHAVTRDEKEVVGNPQRFQKLLDAAAADLIAPA